MVGRVRAQIGTMLYQVEFSGKSYIAEIKNISSGSIEVGSSVYVKVVSKTGQKALLEVVEPEFLCLDSPSDLHIARMAISAGWPDDLESRLLVRVLVLRRMPLRSDIALKVYRKLKSIDKPTVIDAEQILIGFLSSDE